MRLFFAGCVFAALTGMLGNPAFAQTVKVETTPIPRDRRPAFSSLRFLNGTWNCSIMSSRRPAPFRATQTTRISPDGYWMVTRTVTEKVPWNPITIVSEDHLTYDATRSRWIDISMDDYGLYDLSTSPGLSGNSIVWTEVAYPQLHSAAVLYPRTMAKLSDRKTVTTAHFKERSGHVVTVTTTCTKA